MKVPRIDIILPIFNGATTVAQSIRSILKQTENNWRLIIIDNGSTDDSIRICKSFKDQRITLVKCSTRGISHALNAGISKGGAPYIARMDADDIAEPSRIKDQADYLDTHQHIGVVATSVAHLGSSSHIGMMEYIEWNNKLLTHQDMMASRFIDAPLVHPTAMIRRTVFEKYGHYNSEGVPEDFELWLRLFEGGVEFAKLPQIGLSWRDGETRLTRVHDDYSRTSFDKIRMNYLTRLLKNSDISRKKLWIWGAGKHGKNLYRSLLSRGISCEGFIDVAQNKIGKSVLKKPCIDYQLIQACENEFILLAVRKRGARAEMVEFLSERNFRINSHFIPAY